MIIWFLVIAIIVLSFWIVVCLSLYIFPLIFGAPYEGTGRKKVKDIVEIADARKNDKVVDLGSGDGRIVMAFAEKGIEAHGYEINPFLVIASKIKIQKKGLEKKAFIHWKSFWKVNLNKYDIIILFQYKTLMNKIHEKLKKELNKSQKIISYYWKFKKGNFTKNIKDVYLYKAK